MLIKKLSSYRSKKECFKLLEMLKAHKKGVRRVTVNILEDIAQVIGPQGVLAALLDNLKVQGKLVGSGRTLILALDLFYSSNIAMLIWAIGPDPLSDDGPKSGQLFLHLITSLSWVSFAVNIKSEMPISVGSILIKTLQYSLVGSTDIECGHKIAAFHERWTFVAFEALITAIHHIIEPLSEMPDSVCWPKGLISKSIPCSFSHGYTQTMQPIWVLCSIPSHMRCIRQLQLGLQNGPHMQHSQQALVSVEKSEGQWSHAFIAFQGSNKLGHNRPFQFQISCSSGYWPYHTPKSIGIRPYNGHAAWSGHATHPKSITNGPRLRPS
ncbi:hypothetical protein VNO77_19319 [Canavalia gladiata]|uniref:Uncharacterized protein n=1 Tax=Canavalia gladiata TaxID=3824 RepID=A0AAN9LSD0_CANGL